MANELDQEAFGNGFDAQEFGEEGERARSEFGGRSLQEESSRTQGMVRSPAQDRVRKLMGDHS